MPPSTLGSSAPMVRCGHEIGPADVVVRVEGRPKDFLICHDCWRPAESYPIGDALVIRLYGVGPAHNTGAVGPVPCAGCGHPVIRGDHTRMRYVTCSRACTVRACRLHTRSPAAPVSKPCAVCGRVIIGRADQRYCTQACRQRAYRSRMRNSVAS